jgi:hypothetical protein
VGKDNSAPPAPDYSQIAAASEQSAKYSYDLGQKQLQWAKDQYASNKATTDTVVNAALGQMDQASKWAADDRNRYEKIYQPLEEQQAYDAQNWDSPERKERMAGAAEADVAQQFENARTAASSKLEEFGVDPSQTRQGALDAQSRFAEATGRAGAGNNARSQVDMQKQQLLAGAVNVGKGYPAQYTAQQGVQANAGNQAVNSGLATTQSGANTMGTGMGWQTAGNTAMGTWGNVMNTGFQNQLDSWKANQSSSSGVGSVLGTAAGLAGSLMMAEEGGLMTNNLADGGPPTPMPAGPPPPPSGIPGRAVAVPHSGFQVPPQASPTGGQGVDDVPANLTAGEFVVPKDVVQWKGAEWLQKEIMKARRQAASQQTAPAQPTPGPATGAPPRVQTAIPMRA